MAKNFPASIYIETPKSVSCDAKKKKKTPKTLGGFYQGDAPSGAVRNGIPAGPTGGHDPK